MGDLLSLDAVYVAVLFIVPGYILTIFRGYFVVGQHVRDVDFVIKLLTLSGVNIALFGWIIYLGILHGASGAVRVVLWGLVIIVAPAVSGIVSGAWTQKDIFRKIFSRMKIDAVHPIPAGWDYTFLRSKEQWVLVTLKDGTRYGGYWGTNSFASSEPTERDIFIEKVYDLPDVATAAWTPTNKSVLISGGEIQSIEFTPIIGTSP